MVIADRARIRWLLGALAVGLLVALVVIWMKSAVVPPASGQGGQAVTVVEVVDGDTVHVSTASGPDMVRVLGIDTPETRKPLTAVQCGGPEATTYARELLTGEQVSLVADPTQADRDRHHRLLRYIRLADGRDYSVEAARAGVARSYVYGNKPVLEQPAIKAAESEARDAHRGLWGRCSG